ncbi:hypothetical protein Tco_0528696 [Tanacetum coccineum]
METNDKESSAAGIEIHGEEQLDADVDSVIDDHNNTIPYHQYQLNNRVESVLTDISSVVPESEKFKADKNALEESYLEELVWLRNTNKVVTELLQMYGQPVQTVPMLSKRPTFSTKDLHKSALGHCNPLVYDSEETLVQAEVSRTKMLEKMKDPLCKMSSKLINYAKLNSLYDTFVPQKQLSSEQVYWLPANEVASYNCNQSKPITTIVRTRPAKNICSVVLNSNIVVPMSIEPRSNCVKERSRNLELEAKILKMKELLLKDQLQGNDELLRKLKAQISNMKEVSADPNLSTLEFQALETENTQLKKELTAVRIKNSSLSDENVSIKKRYQDLYQSKAESNSNVSSRASISERPKVLALGLYAMTPKIKSVTEASKSKSKCETKTHRNLPARSEKVKRVDNPLRNLNKRNHVDSSLSVKRTGFTSKSVSVCNICNECLVFGNHNKCGDKKLNSMNAKNPMVNNDAIVKQVWKATGKIFATVGSKWKPTGRNFTLGDTCPLTRITKREVVPLEQLGSVSTSEPANNVIVTPRFSKKPLTSYKRKDRKPKVAALDSLDHSDSSDYSIWESTDDDKTESDKDYDQECGKLERGG